MEFWVILLGLAALALAVYLLIINFMEGLAVFCDGWEHKEYHIFVKYIGLSSSTRYWSGLKGTILFIVTLPGAILGLILAIITFQWTHWY